MSSKPTPSKQKNPSAKSQARSAKRAAKKAAKDKKRANRTAEDERREASPGGSSSSKASGKKGGSKRFGKQVGARRGARKERQVQRYADAKHPRLEAAKERVAQARETYHEKAEVEVSVHGHVMEKGNIFKIVGLIAFFAIMVVLVILLYPLVKELFEPGGLDRVIQEVQNAGPLGVLMLLAMQFLQVVVAFIPGEVVQMAAGMMFGPWWGALIIFLGCVISSMFIYEVVHRLGAPFVQSMVPTNWLDKFRKFEESGKLLPIVFVLFFIPGLPKDVFTYLVPLTDMPLKTFILVSCVARIPGIIVSTYAANSLIEGDIWESAVIFAVVGGVALAVLLFRERLMSMLERVSKRKK